jgi:hypothetical protein
MKAELKIRKLRFDIGISNSEYKIGDNIISERKAVKLKKIDKNITTIFI